MTPSTSRKLRSVARRPRGRTASGDYGYKVNALGIGCQRSGRGLDHGSDIKDQGLFRTTPPGLPVCMIFPLRGDPPMRISP